MTDSFGCIVCGADPRKDDCALLRLNEVGISGIWACDAHRYLFERGLQDTPDVLTRVAEIRKMPEFNQ